MYRKCSRTWCKCVVTGEKTWYLPWYPYWRCHHDHCHYQWSSSLLFFSAGRVQIGLQGYTRFTITSSRHNSLPFWDSRQHAFPTRIQSVNKDCVSMGMWCQKISIKDNLINICTLDTWQTILLFLSGLQIRRTLNRSCAWLPHLLKIHHQD